MTNLNTTHAQLSEFTQRIRQRWAETQSMWSDPVQQYFEKDYWLPLEAQAQATLREMERLAQVIAQARRNVK